MKRLGPTLASHMDFNGYKQKNDKVIGGFISLTFWVLAGIFLIIALSSYHNDETPYQNTQSYPLGALDQKMKTRKFDLNELSTMHFDIKDYDWRTYSLEEAEPYISFQLHHYDGESDGDKFINKKTIFDSFHTCGKDDFDRNDLERAYFGQGVGHRENSRMQKLICFKDVDQKKKKIHLQGIRDYEYHKGIGHQFVVLKFKACKNSELSEAQKIRGVKCASKDEQIKWRNDKKVFTFSFKHKINWQVGDKIDISEYIRIEKSFPLKKGIFTDIGYRFQINNFKNHYSLLNYNKREQEFFEVNFYNHDEFEHDDDEKAIAEFYLRMDYEEIVHERKHQQLDQTVIAPIASLISIFALIQQYFFGKLLKFIRLYTEIFFIYQEPQLANLRKMSSGRFKESQLEKLERQIETQNQKESLTQMDPETIIYKLCMIFIKGLSPWAICLKKFMTTDEKHLVEQYKVNKKRLKKDLDLELIIRVNQQYQKMNPQKQTDEKKGDIQPVNDVTKQQPSIELQNQSFFYVNNNVCDMNMSRQKFMSEKPYSEKIKDRAKVHSKVTSLDELMNDVDV